MLEVAFQATRSGCCPCACSAPGAGGGQFSQCGHLSPAADDGIPLAAGLLRTAGDRAGEKQDRPLNPGHPQLALPRSAGRAIRPWQNIPVLSYLLAARQVRQLRRADLRPLPPAGTGDRPHDTGPGLAFSAVAIALLGAMPADLVADRPDHDRHRPPVAAG